MLAIMCRNVIIIKKGGPAVLRKEAEVDGRLDMSRQRHYWKYSFLIHGISLTNLTTNCYC